MPEAPSPEPRRIGVLTFHRCINYGSYWQARCLVEGLRARGHDAELLDHHCADVTWREWRCAFQPLLPDRTPRSDFPHYRAKTRKFLQAFDELPQSERFALAGPLPDREYDLVLVGSDEVWNQRHPWYGGKGLFWGVGVTAPRIATYAASFGNHDAEEGLDPHWAAQLENFAAISVRDENSRAMVSRTTGVDPSVVLDPCLQFPPACAPGALKAPYVAVYGHNFPQWFSDRVRRWADAGGHRLVSLGYRNDWADEQRIDAGPEEFAGAIAGAQAVVTNFFHGCVFALLNARPFACAASSYRSIKVRDLTGALGAERHLLDEASDADQLAASLETPLDPLVGERIAAMRRHSNAYLDRVLG